jgi:hypothetical protein
LIQTLEMAAPITARLHARIALIRRQSGFSGNSYLAERAHMGVAIFREFAVPGAARHLVSHALHG